MTIEGTMNKQEQKEVLVEACGLSKSYAWGNPWLHNNKKSQALLNVSLKVIKGSILAVVGESGSGKSTLARMLVLHEKPDAGSILLDGMDVIKMLPEQLCGFRPQMQLMHQDASTSFNPRFNAVECVEEPLLIKGVKQIDRHKLALESMELSGLMGQFADRSPLELSRGQRQRLAIARVLVLKPKLIIFDESLSGLDLLTQSHIVRLLLDLRQRYDLTYVFISHDLSLMGDIAERIAVMKDGGIVEEQESTHLFSAPQHVETCKLLSAVPRMSQPREPGHRLALQEGSL